MAMNEGDTQYSAYARLVKAATRIPGRTFVTPSPTASTTPAASIPGMSGSFGFTVSIPWRKRVSAKFTPIAWFLISTEPGRGAGFGASASVRTSGPPVSAKTIAFIPLLLDRPDSACTYVIAQEGNGFVYNVAAEDVHDHGYQHAPRSGRGSRCRSDRRLCLGPDQRAPERTRSGAGSGRAELSIEPVRRERQAVDDSAGRGDLQRQVRALRARYAGHRHPER